MMHHTNLKKKKKNTPEVSITNGKFNLRNLAVIAELSIYEETVFMQASIAVCS